MEIVWPVVNFSLFLLVIASIAGGGIFAVQYGVNRWSENRIDSRQNEQIVTERSGTSSCVQPSAFPPPVSNEMVKTRLDRTSLQSAPGIACPTKGMLHNRDLLVPLSGEVLVGGEAWIFVRVFDATGVLPEPVEGWVPAEELVPAE